MKRKILSILLAICLVVSLAPVALADGDFIERGSSFCYVVPNNTASELSEGMYVNKTGQYSFTIFPDASDNGTPALYLLNTSTYTYTQCEGRWEGNTYYVTMQADQPYYWRHSGASKTTKYTVIFNGDGDPATQDDLIDLEVTGGNIYFDPVSGTVASADVTVTEAVIPAEIGGKPVTSIGSRAFEYCKSLTSVTIPDSVTSIGDGAFSRCSALTKVNIPSGVTEIGREVFCLCSNLTDVTIPANVTSIGYQAFGYCTSLADITIPNRVTSIDYRAFFDASLTDVTIPASVQSIGMEAFGSCTKLSSVTISDGVVSIGNGAFDKCTNLTEVTIPASVTEIGADTFSQCTGLTSITVNGNNQNYSSVDGILFNKDETKLIQCPAGRVEAVTIPAGVTSIGVGAFYMCEKLKGVTIPESVTEIGSGAFSYCRAISELTVPDGVTILADNVFNACEGLQKLTIPASVTQIGQSVIPSYITLDVYYGGSASEWEKISIHDNSGFSGSKIAIHYDAYSSPSVTPSGVTFNPGAGTLPTVEVGSDGTLDTIPVPTLSGSLFNGWFTADGTQVTTETVLNDGSTVTAQWTPVEELETGVKGDWTTLVTLYGRVEQLQNLLVSLPDGLNEYLDAQKAALANVLKSSVVNAVAARYTKEYGVEIGDDFTAQIRSATGSWSANVIYDAIEDGSLPRLVEEAAAGL